MKDLHGLLFAYHSDANLGELTRPRNTCSLPYGGRYRLVDFTLSNYVNAGITDVGMVVHASYQSLLDHVGSGKDWELSRKHGGLRILPPFSFADDRHASEYGGIMEALAGVYSYLQDIRQNYIIMGAGDIAVNLPVADVFQQHLDSGADITVVCTRKMYGSPRYNSYLTLNDAGLVCDMSIKPSAVDSPLESLEFYILSKKLLLEMVDYASAHDLNYFDKDILLPRLNTLKIVPYIHEGYCARFQSVAQYFEQSMELLKPEILSDLFNPDRPIHTKDLSNPSTYYGPESKSIRSLVSDGCRIEGEVENSILGRGVIVGKGAKVSNCVLMQGTVVNAGASVSYVIADKNVTVNEGRMLMGHATYPLAIAKGSVV